MEKSRNCSSEEDSCKSKSSRFSDKYCLNADLENKLQEEYPEVIKLIKILHKCIRKQKKKLSVLKGKLKKHKQTVEFGVQTDNVLEAEISVCNLKNPGSITEEITQAAELAVQNSGFVFEETSGLYYDYNTGYYYNAELGLYYDGNSGIYMSYEASTNSYKFHSKVNISPKNLEQETPTKHKTKTKRKTSNQEKNQDSKKKCLPITLDNNNKVSREDLEEGECSDTETTEEEESLASVDNEDSLDGDISKPWPPCIRIIVEETTVTKLKIGSLYIITYEGGSLGREGDHSILIPDINTSKHHLKFSFDKDSNKFMVTDLGSRNGTVLNGKRMSASKQESEAQEVAHGSRIQIGTTILLCHIHNGNETCGLCEPGLVQSNFSEDKVVVTSVTKGMQHKKELQRLRKKFGITYQDNSNVQLASGYSDRAQARRETVGSHNEHEKTEVASVEQSIKPNNIGFKMLSKMGWSEGQSLGKDGAGIAEPIQPKANFNSAGLGSAQSEVLTNQNENGSKGNIWKKTQKRFQQLPASQSIFEDQESD